MDTRWRSYSHSIVTKVIVFILSIICFTGAIKSFMNVIEIYDGYLGVVFEDSYYESRDFKRDSGILISTLTNIVDKYKSEEHVLNGGTITKEEIAIQEESLFADFMENSKSYNPNLSHEENYEIFQDIYSDKILEVKDRLINEDLREYNSYLKRLNEYKGVFYYISDGVNIFTNSENTSSIYFKSYPSYMLFEDFELQVKPKEIEKIDYYWVNSSSKELNEKGSTMYVAFSDDFLKPRIEYWKNSKVMVTNQIYIMGSFLLGLLPSLIYLLLVIGRKSFKDKELHLSQIDKLYTDINIVFCLTLITLWFLLVEAVDFDDIHKIILPVTVPIAMMGLALVLSLVKHIKNRTILTHSLIYTVLAKLFNFIKGIYDSGSVGVKIVLIVIGYPVIVALTFFMFPVTIGVAAWLAFKKVKEFNSIKEGVNKVKDGDLHHVINISGNGEFGKLASDINSITDGLNKAVDNQLKSERLKTELITNVSHDIRTPLTSIITYVDLLKKEKDHVKTQEYLEVLDQKSQRLKILTDDLFEAAKASSGTIPVNYEKIDIVSLITQGLGELNDKIEEQNLQFKVNKPESKTYVRADGRLLWRAIENLLSNILKYALEGSRVYIEIQDLGTEVSLVMKNISAYELNISSDELMERFKRGDESRNSPGSGLGLSITKSLIDIQKGSFRVEIDGDLFKTIMVIPKHIIND